VSQWIYILGEATGNDIKVGKTGESTAIKRINGVNNAQTTDEKYVCLAAVRGERKDEETIKGYFSHLRRTDKGARTEYFWPEAELVEYAAWLRAQYFASPDGHDHAKDWIVVEPDVWLPASTRRMEPPKMADDQLVQDYEASPSSLSGTPWAWFPNPKASIKDYFTPPEIVAAARRGMGGIDLDAASHWLANRKLQIPKYFYRGYSAFEHDWHGRVWLNPPYGDNDPWWSRVLECRAAGQIEQICILSPVWAFTTQIARPLIAASSGLLLLEPTPKFWGNSEGRTGKNHPHAILYIGDRTKQVMEALREFGIPMELLL
jgi:hypothetical protein